MSQFNGVGEIQSGAAYAVREFCRRTGLSKDRIRRQIPVRRIAGRTFVLGADFIDHLMKQERLDPKPRTVFTSTDAGGFLSGPANRSESESSPAVTG